MYHIYDGTKMEFFDYFNDQLTDELYEVMKNVEEIEFGREFNQPINFPNLPNITYLGFGFEFNQPIDFRNLTGLKYISFGALFNQSDTEKRLNRLR